MNDLNEKKISVVIPYYNPRIYLIEAVESVFAQEIRPAEIILVSDGSDDESEEIAQRYVPDVTIIPQANKGTAAAKNTGIRYATGEYLAFLDADDIWTVGKLRTQLTFLMEHPEFDMVFGLVEQFISPELPPESQLTLRDELLKMPGFVAGSMLIKRETFLRVGLFNESIELGDFIDWFSRAKDAGLTYFLMQEFFLKRRIHNRNLGILKRDRIKDYTTLLRDAIARKRLRTNNP